LELVVELLLILGLVVLEVEDKLKENVLVVGTGGIEKGFRKELGG
jgi:hypothetical protein